MKFYCFEKKQKRLQKMLSIFSFASERKEAKLERIKDFLQRC